MKNKTSKLLLSILGVALLVGCTPTPSSSQPGSESSDTNPVTSETTPPVTSESSSEATTEPPSSSEEPVDPTTPLLLGGEEVALANPGELVVDAANNIELVYARAEDGVSRVEFKATDASYEDLVIYLKNPGEGERYTLTFKINPSVAFTGLLNGEPTQFVRGEQDITVNYDEPAEKASLALHFSINEEGMKITNNNVRFSDFVFVEREYDSVDDIVVDGDISDWKNTRAFENTVGVHGITETTKHKSVDFYATLRKDGLLLVAEAYHDKYVDNSGAWHTSTNFEFFLAGGNQRWVSARKVSDAITKSAGVTEAAWVLEELTEEGGPKYHSVVEVFIANASLPTGSRIGDQIRVGFAWKTDGDVNTGGEAAGGGEDAYWVPAGTWTNNAAQTFVTINGIFKEQQIELVFPPKTLTIDGDLSDWAELDAFKTNFAYMEGTGTTAHKNVTFYGYLAVDGLYLAAVAHHDVLINDNATWHMNTNFEMFINGGNQRFVAANGAKEVPFGEAVIVSEALTEAPSNYKSIAEVFIPIEVLGEHEVVRVGFAWKTNGDTATGLGGSGGAADAWWFAPGHTPNNAGQQYYVTAAGVFASNPA